MLPPKRRNRRQSFRCATCGARIGRTSRRETTILYIAPGRGTMVTDAETLSEWLVVCREGHTTIFHGQAVIWDRTHEWYEENAA